MAFVELEEYVSIYSFFFFSFFLFFFFFLDFKSRIAVIFGFLLLNYHKFVTLMLCLYLLLFMPKICNKDSCILYLVYHKVLKYWDT